jgi:hypothetical protein
LLKHEAQGIILNDYALNSLIHGHRVDEDALRIIDNAEIKEFDTTKLREISKEIELANMSSLLS